MNNLYRAAYNRYIDAAATEIDEINPKEFSEANVKVVVQALQGISITKGAARHGDVIGAFFEEILRSGFKQDRGMYFTHDNLVRFMIEAVDLAGLTKRVWAKSNHPENRLPYIMDPACGSGTFLLHAMNTVTSTVKRDYASLVTDHDSETFYKARLSDEQPNYWAEAFVYGIDPKFIMAITAKVNMVLHGDGSAHIFKEDAFQPFTRFSDLRLRPNVESARSVSKTDYAPDMSESFDVVISNPPFGISLSAETRAKLQSTFSMPESTPSEGLFLERCFQLLKPGGRLGVVLPESVLNSKELMGVRLFLYRFFNLRCVVSMPRNIFIDTPTLTSLVFAQKKTPAQIAEWDEAWRSAKAQVEAKQKAAGAAIRKGFAKDHTASEVAKRFLKEMSPVVTSNDWVLKGGKSSALLRFDLDWAGSTGEEAASYFREIVRTSGFAELCQTYIFKEVAKKLDQDFPAFIVEEVGYKLSKRREKARLNQLCWFRGIKSKNEIANLHLAEEEYEVVVEAKLPRTVLDFMQKSVSWE